MATASYIVEVGWLGGTAFAGAHDDVTARTYSATWSRGRQNLSPLTGRSVSSKLSLVLDNRSGDYNSFNSSSPIAGSILPGRRVRIRALDNDGFPYTFPFFFAGEEQPLYNGFVSSITPVPSLRGVDTVRIDAWGPLAQVNEKQVQIPILTNVRTGSAIGTILDKAGWGTQSVDRVLDAGQTTITRIWTGNKVKTLSALQQVETTEAGFLSETQTGGIKFAARQARYSSPHTTSQATYTDDGTGTLTFYSIPQKDPLSGVFNEFEARVRVFTTGTSTVLWTHPEAGAASPFLDVGETRTFSAQYPNADSPVQALAANSWTSPTSGVDWVANENAAGTGTNVTAAIAVTATKYSNSMKLEMSNTGTLKAYLTTIQAQGFAVLVSDPGVISESDATSQTLYGERTYQNPSDWLPDSQEARDWALYNLGLYKDPNPQLEIAVLANKDQNHLHDVLKRDISDRVTVRATGSSGLGINEDFFIEGEVHNIDRRRTHKVTYRLSAVGDFSSYWVIGVSKLGSQTRLVY
jgi:hypothetical protein